MSRKRRDKKKKQGEMQRQLGDDAGAVDAQKLRENQRVSRPELRLVDARAPGGVRGLLSRKPPRVAVVLFLVEPGGARVVGTAELGDGTQRLGKVTYARPAHFLLVGAPGASAGALFAAGLELRVDGEEVTAPAFASDAWEVSREVALAGVDGVTDGIAQSVRGVGREDVTTEWHVGGWTLVIELST